MRVLDDREKRPASRSVAQYADQQIVRVVCAQLARHLRRDLAFGQLERQDHVQERREAGELRDGGERVQHVIAPRLRIVQLFEAEQCG